MPERREIGDIERGLARETHGWPPKSKVRWVLWKTSFGCGVNGSDEWGREGPGCVQPVVGVATGEKGKKVWIDTPSQWEGPWEACKLGIDRTVCALYTSLTAVREQWLGWDCQWCDSTPTQEDSAPTPVGRERSAAFESP